MISPWIKALFPIIGYEKMRKILTRKARIYKLD